MQDIKLEIKLVSEIQGSFLVPSYQRGYRWAKEEVLRLLEDIMSNGQNNYCLQPIVVKKVDDKYELIDGQQRVTTLFLIYSYLHKASGNFFPKAKFSLEYESRQDSADFLLNLELSKKELNIDYFFICQAYETIEQWFSSQKDFDVSMTDINTYFKKNVKVIWYEVNDTINPISLFTRLNIGKIELTSAELVKAMFLSSSSDKDGGIKNKDLQKQLNRQKREEISLQWDDIEKELHNENLWFFLTNNSVNNYQTRIDLLLDMIIKKPGNTKEKYFTFFAFDKMRKESHLSEVWRKIQNAFLVLKDWFDNHELYHKIGYLIASESRTLNDIFDLSLNRTKKELLNKLNEIMKSSVKSDTDYSEMSYENTTHYKSLRKLLLLFNVESVRQNGEQTQWFPFDKFKFDKNKKNSWSLEHIHAQQSEGMKTQDVWKEWLTLHLDSIKSLGERDTLTLQSDIEKAVNRERLDRYEFESLQNRVFDILSTKGNIEYLHTISNLALLNTNDNAALNNSTFDVKRNEVIKMDKMGKFIPFCTKMAFLKYYTPSEKSQLHFWGSSDRMAYVEAINSVLANYLTEKIQISTDEVISNGN
jgi:uncharacterized protein with ParB-like and HNH nuclease domain